MELFNSRVDKTVLIPLHELGRGVQSRLAYPNLDSLEMHRDL